jgi:glycolate oxidase FAD binding subunit
LPKPETEATLLLACESESAALAALRAAAAAPVEASGLAVLPHGSPPLRQERCAALIRLEGPAISVAKRLDDLRALLARSADALGACDSAALWGALRDAAPVAELEGQVWRVSTAPTDGFMLVAALREAKAPLIAYFYDWAGGLVWLCLAEAPDAHAELIRHRLGPLGGHATLVRASAEIRSRIDVFQPQTPALAALSLRLKESFDPRHVLERGRMRAF